MYTPAIQYDDQRPPQLSMQQAEESDDLFGCNVVVVEAEVTAQTQPQGAMLKAPRTLQRSCRSQAYCTGVSPRGTQVRSRSGCNIRPVSSRKTKLAFRSSLFF